MPERIVSLSAEMSDLVRKKVEQISTVTKQTKMLALNALIESTRAGEQGKGFAVVAKEVRLISDTINQYVDELTKQLDDKTAQLNTLGASLVTDLRGTRLADLASNMIDIIDRNLYERSCDVRWWATDSAIVDCVADPTPEKCVYASKRLGVILDAYTVYLDLWIVDKSGKVLASGRPNRYSQVLGSSVENQSWFRDAMNSRDGGEFAVADVSVNGRLDNLPVATYSAAIRENGDTNGAVLGVLGIFFDWEKQAKTVVESVNLKDEEKGITRCMLIDSKFRVIAASDGRGLLEEVLPLKANAKQGNYADGSGNNIGYAQTKGYETYAGLGWYGVVSQKQKRS